MRYLFRYQYLIIIFSGSWFVAEKTGHATLTNFYLNDFLFLLILLVDKGNVLGAHFVSKSINILTEAIKTAYKDWYYFNLKADNNFG